MIIMVTEDDNDSVYQNVIDTNDLTDTKFQTFLETTELKFISRKVQEKNEFIEELLDDCDFDELSVISHKRFKASNWDNVTIHKWITFEL